MLNEQLQQAAELFVAAINSSAEMAVFRVAKAEFQGNAELRSLRKRFSEQQATVQAMRTAGTVEAPEIEGLKELQRMLNSHPATTRYTQVRKELVMRLQDCNERISKVLGFDFASVAAPPSCCG